jgi:hypothetical protein
MFACRDVFAGGQEVRGCAGVRSARFGLSLVGVTAAWDLWPWGRRTAVWWPVERLPGWRYAGADGIACAARRPPVAPPGGAGCVTGAAPEWRCGAGSVRGAGAQPVAGSAWGPTPALRRQGSGSGRSVHNMPAGAAARGRVPRGAPDGPGYLAARPGGWRLAGPSVRWPGRQRVELGASADSAE